MSADVTALSHGRVLLLVFVCAADAVLTLRYCSCTPNIKCMPVAPAGLTLNLPTPPPPKRNQLSGTQCSFTFLAWVGCWLLGLAQCSCGGVGCPCKLVSFQECCVMLCCLPHLSLLPRLQHVLPAKALLLHPSTQQKHCHVCVCCSSLSLTCLSSCLADHLCAPVVGGAVLV